MIAYGVPHALNRNDGSVNAWKDFFTGKPKHSMQLFTKLKRGPDPLLRATDPF